MESVHPRVYNIIIAQKRCQGSSIHKNYFLRLTLELKKKLLIFHGCSKTHYGILLLETNFLFVSQTVK